MYIMRIFILVGREREGGEGGRDRWMDGWNRERERERGKKKRGWMDRLWMDGWINGWIWRN